MLDLTGRLADGWLPSSSFLPPDKLPDAQRRIDDAAAAAGRADDAVRRIYNINGEITGARAGASCRAPPVAGWTSSTALVLDEGMDTFILWAGAPRRQQMETFAHDVAPAVVAAVDAARSTLPPELTATLDRPRLTARAHRRHLVHTVRVCTGNVRCARARRVVCTAACGVHGRRYVVPRTSTR